MRMIPLLPENVSIKRNLGAENEFPNSLSTFMNSSQHNKLDSTGSSLKKGHTIVILQYASIISIKKSSVVQNDYKTGPLLE